VKEYNLIPFAGQTVWVRLEATSTGINGAIADFDDVTITELNRVYWTGGTGNWSNTNLWTPHPPNKLTSAILPAGSYVTLDTMGAEVGAMVVEAGSTMTVNAGGSLGLNGPAFNNGTMNLFGEVTSYAGGNAFVQNGNLFLGPGVALRGFNTGGSDFAFVQTSGATTIGGTLDWGNGIIQVQNGRVEIQNEAAMRGFDTGGQDLAFIQTGGEVLINGTFETTSAGLQGGTMSGGGMLAGNLINSGGVLSPGSSPGKFKITGNYVQTNSGTLKIEVAGRDSSEQDQLQVGGSAELGGSVEVRMVNGFAPDLNEKFQFLTTTNLSGTFSNLNIPSGITLNYSSTGAVPVVTGKVPAEIIAPELAVDSVRFQFGTVSNRSYVVEAAGNVAPVGWDFCTNVTGTGRKVQIVLPRSGTAPRFFRVTQP
jgi:hypothetical protein